MKIFITPGEAFESSAYLAEILGAFGLCFAERKSLSEALATADPNQDLILLPKGSESAGIEAFLRAGGNAVAIRPDESIERLAGLSRKKEDVGPSRLRLVRPVCYGARGEPLWTLEPITVYENQPGPQVAAYLFKPGDYESESLGIVERPVGSGRLLVYAYDPARCIARLRQGYPERVNVLPRGEVIPRSIYLHQPNPPMDTAWRPTADLHGAALCGIIKELLARRGPVPLLWHIPEGRPAALIYSGDEDGGFQEANHQEMRDLESFGGTMSLNIFADQTSATPAQIEEYTRRGHTISVHPNLTGFCSQPVDKQIAKAEADVLLFRKKFDQAVRTVRNHSFMWPGYLDLPELWERLGIGMDTNTFASLYAQSPDFGPFVNVNSAIPLRFVREDGRLINVYQQPTHICDDGTLHSTHKYSQKYSVAQFDWLTQRIFADAVRFFHAPICVNNHPVGYVDFSGESGRLIMLQARKLGMPIWSVDRWHNFWRNRASWRIDGIAWNGSRLTFSLKGNPCEALWLMLPATANGGALQALKLNDAPMNFEEVPRYGSLVVQAPLPPGASQIDVAAAYASTP